MDKTYEQILDNMSIKQLDKYMSEMKEFQNNEIAKELEEKNPNLTKKLFINMSVSIDYFHSAIERKRIEKREDEDTDKLWFSFYIKSLELDKQMLKLMKFKNPPPETKAS